MNLSKSPKIISLFSGAGGMDLGLEAAGFESRFLSDIDQHSCQTLEMGKEHARRLKKPFLEKAIVRQADVRLLSGKQILADCNLKLGQVDVLCGGPPCQAFSVFGKRKGREDPRGMLVYEYLRLLREIQPKTFVFENVYGLLSIEGGAVFRELCEKLKDDKDGLGYTLSVFRLNAADFGVPQYRDRVFILGSRDGKTVPEITPVCVPHGMFPSLGRPPHRTVEDALRGLPEIGDPSLRSHVGRVHSERIVTRYSLMAPGERDSHTRINKLDLGKPSFTIIVGSDAGGGKGHVHPTEAREVTPRESARIQTFPDWWGFSGTSRHPIRQVGNAVPPLLAAAVGNAMRKWFFGLPPKTMEEMVEVLDQQHLFKRSRNSQRESPSRRRMYRGKITV